MAHRKLTAVTSPLGACALLWLSSVSGQVPPRRLAIGAGDLTPGVPASRTLDLGDGTALPAWVHSVRISREGEVVRTQPDLQSARRGTLARNARFAPLESTQGRGCARFWVRIGPEAWVCADDVEFTDDPPSAQTQPSVPDGAVVPFQYAFATHAGVRTYRRLDDIADDNWAEELERGMSVAVIGTARTDGGTYVHTASNRWVSLRHLSWARPSERAGIFYDPQESPNQIGFLRFDLRAWPTPEAALHDHGPPGSSVTLGRRDGVHIREERVIRGVRLVRVDAGWIPSANLQRPEIPAAPSDLATEERWVDVDRAHQIMVAFEGVRPVFSTLVSTGRPGSPTAPGEHRVWAKVATTDMSNVDDDSVETVASLYTVSRVPWVMFFHGDQALHGAFWHDSFGRSHSHGCVNLAPRDAAWLYNWAPPHTPAGWTAVQPTAAEPGLRVRVR